MSTHRDCGKDIAWFPRSDEPGRWLPPMEFVGHLYAKQPDGTVEQVATYQIHNCDPEELEAWQERLRRIAKAKGESVEEVTGAEMYQAAKEQRQQEAWALALVVVCPRCSAAVDEKCWNLSSLRLAKGDTAKAQRTSNPHPERTEAALKEKANA